MQFRAIAKFQRPSVSRPDSALRLFQFSHVLDKRLFVHLLKIVSVIGTTPFPWPSLTKPAYLPSLDTQM